MDWNASVAEAAWALQRFLRGDEPDNALEREVSVFLEYFSLGVSKNPPSEREK